MGSPDSVLPSEVEARAINTGIFSVVFAFLYYFIENVPPCLFILFLRGLNLCTWGFHFFAAPVMQPIKKTMRRCDQGLHAAKTFPAGVKETTSFLYPDFGKSIPHVINSQSTGGYVLANKNASPISRISFAESPNEKVVVFSFFANGSYILARTPIFFCCFFDYCFIQ